MSGQNPEFSIIVLFGRDRLEPCLSSLLSQENANFEIIAGYRRFRAATRAGLPTIPCISQKSDDKETEILKVHENIHRLPLSHVDQGNTFRYLRDTFNMSETEIAALVGKSVPYISQHLTLVNSDPDIIAAVKAEEISYSASRSLSFRLKIRTSENAFSISSGRTAQLSPFSKSGSGKQTGLSILKIMVFLSNQMLLFRLIPATRLFLAKVATPSRQSKI